MEKQKGFTIVELLVVIVILLAVLSVTYSTTITQLGGFKRQTKTAEIQMENLIGLELLRYDIEMAGYGLPYDLNSNQYIEAAIDGTYTPNPDHADLDDAASYAPPRAFVLSNNGNTNSGNSDVLGMKSLTAALNDTSEKWSYRYHDGSNWVNKSWSNSNYNFAAGERIIVMSAVLKVLQPAGPATWDFSSSTVPDPADNDLIYLIYGVAPSGTSLRMPFNRVDYYLKRPTSGFPEKCNPDTYVLYRALISHSNGKRSPENPVIDCVADFQVAFCVDDNPEDDVCDSSTEWDNDLSALSDAEDVRTQVKGLRVFILTHDGQFDKDYTYNGTTITLGDGDTGIINFDLTGLTDYSNYRWKVLKLSVRPINLAEAG